ncbi:MAG: hypothetical protein P8010_01285 [Desulfosarcinaceae bacterium]|jgi:hypothetical protein
MIRTLVSVYPDLSSVIAMNYACLLSRIIDMGIQPIFVKEPEPGADVPGVGWVRRTWENSLLDMERDAVDQLIEAERAHCANLARPQVIVGNRDDAILSNLMGGTYDLFVEGSVASFEQSELQQRIESRLYRSLPCPVIIARNLIELRKVLVVFDDEVNVDKLLQAMINLFDGAKLRFDLLFCRMLGTGLSVGPIEKAEGLFVEADETLSRHGWAPENRLALQGTPQGLLKRIEDYSLIVTGMPQGAAASNGLLHLLGETPAPILLCRQ